MTTAEKFKARLSALGLNQSSFARLAGTPLRTIQDWAGGKRRVPGIAFTWLDLYEQVLRLREAEARPDRQSDDQEGR